MNVPPGSDTVSDVGEEVPTLEFDKVSEDGCLEELTVELGDTIHLERSDNGKEGHSNVFWATFLDDRHTFDSAHVIRPSLRNLIEELEVDFVDDLQMSRKELFKQADFPFLERFGEDSVASNQLSPAKTSKTHLVYAKTLVTIFQAWSHATSSSSSRILINSGIAKVGWVSFIWIQM